MTVDYVNTSHLALFPFSAGPSAALLESSFGYASHASGNGFFSGDTNLFRDTDTPISSSSNKNNSRQLSTTSSTSIASDAPRTRQKTETVVSNNHLNSNNTTSSGSSTLTLVRVAMHEQVSALYDGVTDEPSCHVEGSIYVQTTKDLESKPFLLVIRDLDGHVASWKDWPSTCQNVSAVVSRKGLQRTDRVLRIRTKSDLQTSHSAGPEATNIAQYICSEPVRHVPLVRSYYVVENSQVFKNLFTCSLNCFGCVASFCRQLIKSRVVANRGYCRVGFKIRAIPSNAHPLTRVVLCSNTCKKCAKIK